MRKEQKDRILQILASIDQVHHQLEKLLNQGDVEQAAVCLEDCQNAAIAVGTQIEQSEGEGTGAVRLLEEYCELVYKIHESIPAGGQDTTAGIFKTLDGQLCQIKNQVEKEVPIRREVVFLPYKASMWDSLESVWRAAEEDPECDAYVIPIPYFDRNQDGSAKEMHYEGDLYPDYVPVTRYDRFDFSVHRPDIVFIHNPYDGANFVTSVHPFFYSDNLKKYTNCLVYIPYFASSGGMSEGQRLCPVYLHADYIVIQSEKYRKFYDERIPDEKFLALGSPKFDSVIHRCQNPPEPSAEWKKKMTNADGTKKEVYFYNTTLGTMLGDTERFLKKLEYTFSIFQRRKDVCLLWRPHPLLEATFDSMRPQYKQRYLDLKNEFTRNEIGIYDETPCLEDTLAVSDIYIGDGGSSVVSLFGVAGKPIFLFHYGITEALQEDDWKANYYNKPPRGDGQNRYVVQPNNKLYYSPKNDLHYEYFCDLSEYAGGDYYSGAIAYNGKIYVMPANARHILVIDEQTKKKRKIELEKETEQPGAFCGFAYWNDVVYLYPFNYSSLVIFHLKNEKISYLTAVSDFYITEIRGEKVQAARWIWRNRMYILNPTGDRLLSFGLDKLDVEEKDVDLGRLYVGTARAEIDGDELWLLPYEGTIVTRWNLVTGEKKDYDLTIEGLTSIHPKYKEACDYRYFASVGFKEKSIIFSPGWGNKFVELFPESGEVREWIPPFPFSMEDKSSYRQNWGRGHFIRDLNDRSYRYFYAPEQITYDVNLETKECSTVDIYYDKEEVAGHAPGYVKWSEWTQYVCVEDVFNTLEQLLDRMIQGGQYNKEAELAAYESINASPEGDCGKKVYEFLKNR